MKRSIWYEDAVFYGMDIRRFQDSNGDGIGDIRGLISRLDYLTDLGITALWLLPFQDTPLQDNGYDVRDYYQVDPRVGTLDDFIELVQETKKRDIHLVMDLVMNHTSKEHPWFEASRRDPHSRYRNYYVWTEEIPEDDQYSGEPVFPGEEDSVWTYDPVAKAYYYHRFYHFQPDMRTSNPMVQEEIFRALDFWLALGVDGFRIDAAPLMVEPKGLESTVIEDPFKLFRELHHHAVSRKPDVVLLGEANVPMDDMDKFFGGGSMMNMLFNFLLGPHILLSFARENAQPIHTYLEDLLEPPENDQWLNFIRNHDEMTLEIMPEEQRQVIYEHFAPKEEQRIYDRGLRERITPILSGEGKPMHREKLEMAFSLLFSTPGTPIFMYGDEIGMGSDLSLPGRFPVRTPMQWSDEKNAGFSTADDLIAPVIDEGPFSYKAINVEHQKADANSFWHFMKQMIAERKDAPEVGLCPVNLLEPEKRDPRLLIHYFMPVQDSPRQNPLVFIHNVSPDTVSGVIDHEVISQDEAKVRLGRGKLVRAEKAKMEVELPPYGYLWIQE